MIIVFGLGNPGAEYEHTRHNIGFRVVDKLAERNSQKFTKGKGNYFQATFRLKNKKFLLIKPMTFMNESGRAVQQVCQFYKIQEFSNLLVVLDDINLPLGTIRLRPDGTDGGQKGLRSILQTMGTLRIPRLRIGIGFPKGEARKYVLSKFSKSEQKFLPEIIDTAADAVESFGLQGLDVTMNQFNKQLFTNIEEERR